MSETTLLPKRKRQRITLSLYLNYLIHGFSLVIIAQNMPALSQTFNTTVAKIAFVTSGIGIGRMIGYLLTGTFSDRFPRKYILIIGMLCYLAFAWGIVLAPNTQVIYFLTILVGMGNSALDASTYTTLVEINGGKSYATILIKGFMSIGEFILPLMVAFLQQNSLWYGWSFVIMGALVVINLINFSLTKFPSTKLAAEMAEKEQASRPKSQRILATVFLSLYGYVSMALMIWFTQWITLYGKEFLHYSETISQVLMSAYSLGSISGVVLLFWLSKNFLGNHTLLIGCNTSALLALFVLLVSHQPIIVNVACFVFGMSCAGGVMQIGLTVLMNLHPRHRGLMTSLYYFFGSLASFSVPLISGKLSESSYRLALGGDLVVSISAFILVSLIVFTLRSRKD